MAACEAIVCGHPSQYLSLTLLIRHIKGLMEAENQPGLQRTAKLRPEKTPKQLWSLARMLSLYDLHQGSRETRSWAHGNLMELYLLSLLPDCRIAGTDRLVSKSRGRTECHRAYRSVDRNRRMGFFRGLFDEA